MRRPIILLLATTTLCGESAAEPVSRREIDNVKAFARVCGVLRFFYPSDAAAEMDWAR
jgi:hypothetical protein